MTCQVFSQTRTSAQQKIDAFIAQSKLDSAKSYIQDKLTNGIAHNQRQQLEYEYVKVLFMQSAYNDALKHAFSSLDKIPKESKRVKFNFLIACIYSAITDRQKSIEYFNLVLEHNQNDALNIKTHLLLSELYAEIHDTTQAKQSINDAYQLVTHTPVDVQIKSIVERQYNYNSANYETCKRQNFVIINDSSSFLNTKSHAYSMLGDCYVRQDSLPNSIFYYQKFLELTLETEDPEQIKIASNKLIEIHEALGNQEEANTYHKIYNEAVKDSSSFSVDKYREIYQLEKDRELQHIRFNNTQNNVLIRLGLVLLLATGLYFYSKKKPKKKSEKKPGKKIAIPATETQNIKEALSQIVSKQLFLYSTISRKSVCKEYDIKSERYLSHYINEEYEKSFSVFVNDLRIEYAFERLHADAKLRSYKIEQIAKECGFGSRKSFERVFLAKYKETPFKVISRLSES